MGIKAHWKKIDWLIAAEAAAGNLVSLLTDTKYVLQPKSQSAVKSTSTPF